MDGLQWKDLNFEADSFWVGKHTFVKNDIYTEDGKKIKGKIIVEDSGKTSHAVRELPLGTFLANIFKMKYQEYLDKGITPKPTDFIFYTKAGNPFFEQSLRRMYKSLAKKLQNNLLVGLKLYLPIFILMMNIREKQLTKLTSNMKIIYH